MTKHESFPDHGIKTFVCQNVAYDIFHRDDSIDIQM